MSAEDQKNIQLQYAEYCRRFRLLDDDFSSLVFSDNMEAVTLLLHIILERNDIQVTDVVTQRVFVNPVGHSVRFDIHAVDRNGKNYNIEIQRADSGAAVQRARYNSSMLDSHMLAPGQDYSSLAETYVIFITEHDVLQDGFPIYHIDRFIAESGKDFGDGSHILYVNGAYKNETNDIGKLIHDFHCTSAGEMYYAVLAERVKYLKETEGGHKKMCKLMEELCTKAGNEAVQKERMEVARRVLDMGLGIKEAALLSKLSTEEVEALADN